MKKYNIQLIQIHTWDYEVEAENRVHAEEKAKEFYNNYYEDDFFGASANSLTKEIFKITCPEREKKIK